MQLLGRVVWLTVILVSACGVPEPPKFVFTHSERRGRFANGVRFVLMPDSTTQLVQVDVRYEVGSREDPEGKAGLAHLVEHLMFQQRPDGPASPPLMQSIGELSTSFNAYTTWDKTHYETGARAANLDALIKIEAIRLFYGCQTISPDELAREREVVRNELRQRAGTPEGQIPQVLLSAIYPRGHAYSRMVGGDDRQVSSMSLEDACGFIAKYYAPERATVIIAGGFNVDTAVASLEKWFGRIAKRTPAPRTPVVPVDPTPGPPVEVSLDVEHPSVHALWPMPPDGTPESDAARLGLFIAMSRLAQRADEYDFAYQVTPELLGGDLAPAFAISMTLKDISKVDAAIDFVRKSARTAGWGIDKIPDELLEEQANRRKAAFIAELEPLAARTNTVAELIQRGDLDFDSQGVYLFHELDKLGKLDGAQVAAAIKRYADPDRARIVVIKPSRQGSHGDPRSSVVFTAKSDDQLAESEVDPAEAARPIEVAAEPTNAAGARRFALANGVRVVLLPIKAMPLIAARLIFANAGEAAAPDSPALAAAAADFLAMPFFSEAFERAGINVDCRATADATICESAGMTIYQDLVIRGLDRLIRAGGYQQRAIEHWQKHVHDRFTAEHRQDVELRRQELAALFGADHPYAKTAAITPRDADAVHRDALDRFRNSHYTAGNATLVVAGDFDAAVIERSIREVYGAWPASAADKPNVASAPVHAGPVAIGVIGSDAPQLRVVLAYPAPAGVDRNAGARAVLTEMLSLRVGDLRFKLGSTYGVYARHATRTGPSAYEVGGSIDADRAGESIKAMRAGLAALRAGDHFDEDFVRARRKIVSELLGQSTVTSELADRLGFIATHDLAADYYAQLLQQVAALTPDQVRALIHDELAADHEVITVLGDRSHLERAFADAGISGAKLIEPEK